MSMTKGQLEYALGKVDRALREKEQVVRSKYTTPAKRLPDHERAALVRGGKVSLRKEVKDISYHTRVAEAFDFTEYEWPDKVDDKAVAKEMAPLRKEAEKLRDQIVLGDQEAALAAIETFSASCGC